MFWFVYLQLLRIEFIFNFTDVFVIMLDEICDLFCVISHYVTNRTSL